MSANMLAHILRGPEVLDPALKQGAVAFAEARLAALRGWVGQLRGPKGPTPALVWSGSARRLASVAWMGSNTSSMPRLIRKATAPGTWA